MAKNKGVMVSEYKPDSSVSLEGEHAKKLAKHAIGKKVTISISGTKTRHVINHDGTHSVNLKVNSVESSEKEEKNEAEDKD